MGCCGKKPVGVDAYGKNEVTKAGVAPSATRKCRDCFCCLLFLVFWIGMAAVAIVGLINGQPKRLLYGTDYNGTTCGTGDMSNRTLTFYPRVTEDMLEQARDPSLSVTDYSFYGLCVSECPAKGKYICNYGAEAEIQSNLALTTDAAREQERKARADMTSLDATDCWFVAMDSNTVLFRCIQMTDSNSTSVETCVYPADSPEYYDNVHGVLTPNSKCQVKSVRTVSDATGPAQSVPIYDQLQTVASVIGRCIGDIERTWPIILLCGGLLALVMGFVVILFLKYCAGCVVWIILWGFVLTLLIFSLLLSTKAGIITNSTISNLTSNLKNAGLVTASQNGLTIPENLRASETKKQVYAVAAYVFYALTGIGFLLVCFFQKKIRITIGIIKEASRAIQRLPLLVLFPIWPIVMMLVLFIYSAIIAAYIYSSASVSLDGLTGSASVLNNNTTETMLSKVNSNQAMRIMFAYHFFGFLWTNQLINAISMCTIAGAVCRYYWCKEKTAANIGRFPILYSFKNCFRYHFGSLAFGALIIAIVQFIRAVLLYIDHQTQGVQKSNLVVKVMMKVVQCCLWCLEKCLRFLSKNAYIMIAMKGHSFCASAKNAFKVILTNLGQVGTVSMVTFLLLGAGKIAISMTCAIVTFAYIEANQGKYGIGAPHEISSPMAPILLSLLLAWFVASTFLGVYEMAIDTILMCFCEDKEMNKDTGEYFMSEQLQRFVASVPHAQPPATTAS